MGDKVLGLSKDTWKAIQGMGEAFAGRGPQWKVAQARMQEAEALKAAQEERSRQAKVSNVKDESQQLAAYTFGKLRRMVGTEYDETDFQDTLKMHLRGMAGMGANRQALNDLGRVLMSPGKRENMLMQYMQDIEPMFGGENEASHQKGSSVIYTRDGKTYMGMSTFNPVTNQMEMLEQEIDGNMVNSAGLTPEGVVDFERSKAGAREQGKGEASRKQEVINLGLRASRQVPIFARNLELLNDLNTGGYDGAGMKIRNSLGIEGADERELTTNMARAVLSQLRDTFGAQFTEREGNQLKEIEPNIGNSTAGNKRILAQLLSLAQFKAERAISAARANGDYYTVQEIEANMNRSMTPQETPQKTSSGEIKFLGFE